MAVACVLPGCQGPKPRPDGPIVYSIGASSILTYVPPLENKVVNSATSPAQPNTGVKVWTPSNTAATKTLEGDSLYIPVHGRDLVDPGFGLRVGIEGTVPAVSGVDYEVHKIVSNEPNYARGAEPFPPPQVDTLLIEMRRSYVEKLRKGDRIRVDVLIQESDAAYNLRRCKHDKNYDKHRAILPQQVSQASRTFTVYPTTEYRNEVIDRLVKLHDISAFPLPEKEVEFLFGEKIRRHFFVVRLSVRNTLEKDQIVTTSMIKASGIAMVESGHEPPLRFVVPVETTPQSLSHVFTMLSDEEPAEFRSVVFRTIEFGGALTAAIFGIAEVGLAATEALGVATGVGIPGAKSLWTD